MQIPPAPGIAQPNAASAMAAVAAPATPAAPIEPARRVTANRDGGRSDLQAQQQPQKSARTPARGRLLDLFV
ncbi:MAG TPA: hypothetical protein VN668_11595 [Stellaceae bacterium]|nr:hypothetical protein [Stellaceae bacterium]